MPDLNTAARWTETLLGFIYPPICQLCGNERATKAGGYVGINCWQSVKFIRPPFCQRCGLPFEGAISNEFECNNCRDQELAFTYARAAVEAKGVVRDVIHRFKYQQALWFLPFLADLLQREALPVLKAADHRWDAIVPVPLHGQKKREREFNQAELLGAELAQALQRPLRTDWVKRTLPTPTQTTLSRTERAENVRRAFTRPSELTLDGQHLIVVDDVFTTGATANAVARELRRAGAASVVVWAVARGV